MKALRPVATMLGLLCAGAAAPESGYRIALTSFAPLNTDIFIANADGSGERPFLPHPDLDYNASFSRDGQWLVFTSRRNGSADIFRAHPDGSGLEALVNDPAFDDQAALSPDGRSLAFVSSRGGQVDIWLLDLRSRRLRNLTNHPGGDFRPHWSTDGEWIAFSSDRDSTMPRIPRTAFAVRHVTELYVMRADGSQQRRLTHDAEVAGSPSFSADGKRLVFYSATLIEVMKFSSPRREAGTSQIETLELATGRREVVSSGNGAKWSPRWLAPDRIGYVTRSGGVEFTTGPAGARGEFRAPAWSSNGRQMVFHRDVDTAWPPNRAWHGNDPEFSLRRVGVFPSYSPDGKYFALNEGLAGILSRGINISSADGSELRPLHFEDGRNAIAPDWSRHGDRIAFGLGRFFANTQGGAPRADIAIINADGSGFAVLTDGAANCGFPGWSPDGEQIVYRRTMPGRNSLQILDVATKASRELIGGIANYNFPAWSPTGERISFTSDQDGEYDIYSIAVDGTGLRRLARIPWNDAHNRWSPDGKWIVFACGRGGFKDETSLHVGNPQAYGEICVMRADGSDVRSLTDDQFEDGTPTWIP